MNWKRWPTVVERLTAGLTADQRWHMAQAQYERLTDAQALLGALTELRSRSASSNDPAIIHECEWQEELLLGLSDADTRELVFQALSAPAFPTVCLGSTVDA